MESKPIILKKILVMLSVPISLVFYLFFYVFENVDRKSVKSEYIKMNIERKFDPPVDVLIVGDSTVNSSIMPSRISNQSVSFATPGSSLLTTRFLLEKFLRNNEAPKCLIIGNSFLGNYHYNTTFWDYFAFYNLINLQEAKSIYIESKTHEIFPSDRLGYFEYIIRFFLFSSKILGIPFKVIKSSFDDREEISRGAKNYLAYLNYSRGYAPFPYHGMKSYSYNFFAPLDEISSDLAIDKADEFHLVQLARTLSKFNTVIYFFLVPEYQNNLKMKNYNNLVQDYVASKIGHIIKLNFFRPKSNFTDDDFFDVTHLNGKGAEIVSDELGALLTNCREINAPR